MCLNSKQATRQKHQLFFPLSLQDHLHPFFPPQRLSSAVSAGRGRVCQATSLPPGCSRWSRMLEQSLGPPSGTQSTPLDAGSALSLAVSRCYPVLVAALSRHFGTFLLGTSSVYLRDSKSCWSFKLLYYYNLLLQISFKKKPKSLLHHCQEFQKGKSQEF